MTRREAGFSLAALIFFMTAASIVLAVAVPAYEMQAQREREEELIFRGEEYARAIQKYHRKFNQYPPSLDALVATNGIRFLRRQYKDPISDKPFRLISISPDGATVIGSTILQRQPTSTPASGGAQSFVQPGLGGQSPAAGQAIPKAQQPSSQLPSGGLNQNPRGQTATAGVIGVGSDAEGDGVKVYNTRQKYNEWEFVAILSQPTTGTGGATGATGGGAGGATGGTGGTGATKGAGGTAGGAGITPPPRTPPGATGTKR
jgi:type II secretory pathway pseudopilin PulG